MIRRFLDFVLSERIMSVETTSKIIRYRIPVRGDNIGDVAKLKIENDEIVLTFPNDAVKQVATVNKLIYMDENY